MLCKNASHNFYSRCKPVYSFFLISAGILDKDYQQQWCLSAKECLSSKHHHFYYKLTQKWRWFWWWWWWSQSYDDLKPYQNSVIVIFKITGLFVNYSLTMNSMETSCWKKIKLLNCLQHTVYISVAKQWEMTPKILKTKVGSNNLLLLFSTYKCI